MLRPTLPLPIALLVLVASCGDFAEFDRRRAQQTSGGSTNSDRRIIINKGGSGGGPGGNEGGGGGQQDAGVTPPPVLDGGGSPPPQADSGATPPPTPDSGPPPSTGKCGMNAFEEEVFNIVNQNRQNSGLQPYQCDAKAVQVARSYSALMCQTGHFSHYGPDGSTPWTRLKAGGVSYSSAGENIAAGQTTPEKVMTSWMNSSGHRANIMSSSFTHIGVGYDNCGNGYKHYWTQSFFRP
jgi:uncharacterized protein YkwD